MTPGTKVKRSLSLVLAVVLLLSMLPFGFLNGILEVKAAASANSIMLFDDAFSGSIKASDTANVTVTDNVAGADGTPSTVLSLGNGWALSKFCTGNTPIDITAAVENAGDLVFDIYAAYATTDSEIRAYTAPWQGAKTSFTKALSQGWNTVVIPASEIGSTDFYGIGIVSHTSTCYVDNVRFEWHPREIQIDAQPVSATVRVNERINVSVSASFSDGSDASALRYQWYQCADTDGTNPIPLEGEMAASCTLMLPAAKTSYFYCVISAQGVDSIVSDVVAITAVLEENQIVLFDDGFSDSFKSADQAGISVAEGIEGADGDPSTVIALSGGWVLGRFGTGQTPMNIAEAVENAGRLVFDMYASYATSDTEIRIYTGAWQSAQVSFAKALSQGWNTVAIPASDIGSTDFYGIGILSHTGTCYVDNVRFEWGTASEETPSVVASGQCGDNATWELTGDGVLTVSGAGAMAEYPDLKTPWKEYRESVKKLVIEDGITTVGGYAFFDCINLTSITVPDSVTELGTAAFWDCTGLTEFTIPDSITSLGNGVFRGCTGLTEFTIPDRFTEIPDRFFSNCTGLTSVCVSDHLTSIGESAFNNCVGLTEAILPNTLTTLGWYAFQGCTALVSVTIPDSITTLSGYAFAKCSGLTSVTIPESVTVIESAAFMECTGLTAITIPDSVVTLDHNVFIGCTGLTAVTVPNSVVTLGNYVFANCTGLTEFHIPDGVVSLGMGIVYGCTGLTEFTIPDRFTELPDLFLGKCTGLTSIVIPEGVTKIGNYLLSGCTNLTSVTLPDTLTTIGDSAFSKCTALTVIDIPEGVTAIGRGAFESCSKLRSVVIPEGVTVINGQTFGECNSLTSLDIPAGVTTVHYQAFIRNSGLKKITFHSPTPPTVQQTTPNIPTPLFKWTTATICYPDTAAWTEEFRLSCGGNVTWEPYQTVFSAGVTLDSVLGVNFAATKGGILNVTVGGESYDVTENDGIYTVCVFAQDMTKDIVATLMDSEGAVLDTQTFTLAGYVASLNEGNYTAQEKALAAATLDYCRSAAKANGNYSGEMNTLAQIPQGAFDGYAFSGGKAPAGTSIHCYLEEACELRLRMATDAYTVCVDGVETGPQELNGTYVYSVGEMLAQDYDKAYTFTVTDGEGTEVFSGSYSVMGYLGKCLERGLGGEDMQNLLKAMYHYHIAAAAYEAVNAAG